MCAKMATLLLLDYSSISREGTLLQALFATCTLVVLYVIVIAQAPGIYGSKQTEFEGIARGRSLFTTAINPWPPTYLCYNCYISHLIGPLVLLL